MILEEDTSIQKQFSALEQQILAEGGPDAKRTFQCVVNSVEVIHFPHLKAWVNTQYGPKLKSISKAYFRIRAKTPDGYTINVTKRDTPGNANLVRKRQNFQETFDDLIGQTVFATLYISPNGRYYANAIASKLPDHLKK